MAANYQPISIKILVDKEKNQVLYAESDHDFVDVLFSFLTLPLGTITRLFRCPQSSFSEIGCMNKLYESANDINTSYLQTDACKKMLLNPHRASEAECSKLKLNLEGRKHKELYLCGTFSAECMLSPYYGVPCSCGSFTTHNAYIEEPSCVSRADGVFVKGSSGERYIVSDDLHVMAGSIPTCMFMLDKLGIGDDVSKIEERTVTVGVQEMLQLLRRSWISQTPLTDVFLSNQGALEMVKREPSGRTILCGKESATGSTDKKFEVKLILRKATNQVLYAEANHDFVDQLFSFLTFPLGSVFNIFGGKCFLKGSIHNIYSSAMELRSNSILESKEGETLLTHPKLSPFYGCDNQLLSIEEDAPPRYNCKQRKGNGWRLFVLTEVDAASTSNSRSPGKKNSSSMDGLAVMNPKTPFSNSNIQGGFVKGNSKFMVTDDLVVTPLSHTSCLFFLRRLNVPYHDIEERIVNVGKEEVLNLLKASLISEAALRSLVEGTDDMFPTVNQEMEVCIGNPKHKQVKPLTIREILNILGDKTESTG
ncbi:hypothetical protein AQUCO_00900793v1 [Aquilegia coerulea]|uniref:DUF674 family protein n=1 Tax=Aquilegia coerulea TaxID=218851 RepID=A0A2G5EFG1_AQUCA|nr:hypothetical protein AQUCO_00900793v1 [Aquilegia coerulea]